MSDSLNNVTGGFLEGRRIAVVGGGLGGLCAANCFAQFGADVTVFEKAPEISEVGAGIQITPNGARVLSALGLGKAADEKSVRAQAIVPMDGVSGREITRFDLQDRGKAYRFFHRADLINLLTKGALARGVRVKTGSEVIEYKDNVVISKDGTSARFDLIVGADGVHSKLREYLNPDVAQFFTGQVAWRGVVDEPNAEPVARVWMAPGKHIVTYPLSGGRMNIVAVQERESWAAEGWNHPDTPANLRAAFADCAAPLQSMIRKIDEPLLWGLFRHPVAENWFSGSKVILGDAAHPTLPFLAQGANLAFEDAWVLATSCNNNKDIGDALNAYQGSRQARVSKAIDAANRNAVNFHLKGAQRWVSHRALAFIGATAPHAFLNRLNWLYDYDVTQTSTDGPHAR